VNCLKCGRDIEEDQVFCPECLEDMEKYPVKPNIAIQLPHRKETPVLKKMHIKRRQPPTPEEQIHRLKKRLRVVLILWLLTLVLLAVTIYPTFDYFFGEDIPLPGQNYHTVTSTESTAP